MTWQHQHELGDPARILERKQEREARQKANSRQGRAQRAREGLESLFGGCMTTYQEPLFSSAHAAIVFALNFNHQQCDRPLTSRLHGKLPPSGKGLAGLDGAAQAGIIRGMIGKLSDHECALLIAYCCPKKLPMPGSPGDKVIVENKAVRIDRWTVNPEYQHAIHEIANSHHIRELTSSDFISIRAIRVGCVARCFGDDIHLGELAERCKVSYPTIKRQHRAVREYLMGRDGDGENDAKTGAIQLAMNRAELLFQEGQLIA